MSSLPSVLDVIVLEFLHPNETPDALQVLHTPHKQDLEDWRWSEKRQVVTYDDMTEETYIEIDDICHSTTQPAKKDDSQEWWYFRGQIHRDRDLPAYTNHFVGWWAWYQHGELHRDDNKPAEITKGGMRMWYRHGIRYYPKKGDEIDVLVKNQLCPPIP